MVERDRGREVRERERGLEEKDEGPIQIEWERK